MQSWEEYEADYFRGKANRYEAEFYEDENRWGIKNNERCHLADNAMEMIGDMDAMEKLFGPVAQELLGLVRRLCDSMDGDGCIAMDGEMTAELKDLLVDRIVEEWDGPMNMGLGKLGEKDEIGAAILRELIITLLIGEILRRRYRRRHGAVRRHISPLSGKKRKRLPF